MILDWPNSYGLVGGGSTPAPATPTITINDDETIVTVSGSTSGSTNTVYVANSPTAYGSVSGTSSGSRSSDGAVTITPALDPGRYWVYVVSTTAGGAAVSNLLFIRVGVPTGTLTHSPADVLRRLLIAIGQGVTPASGTNSNWPIFESQEPSSPDNVVTTYDVDGRDFGRTGLTGERFEHHGVQVRVRAATKPVCWRKMREICVALDEDVYQESVTIDGTNYFVHAVHRVSKPLYNGLEPGTQRHVYTMSVIVNLHQTVNV